MRPALSSKTIKKNYKENHQYIQMKQKLQYNRGKRSTYLERFDKNVSSP